MTETFYDRDLSPDPKDGPGLPLGRITDDEAISRFDILNLFGKERLEKIQSTIAKATGLALVTLDYKGDPLTEMTGFTPFCQEMRQGENSAQLCRSSDVYGAGQALARQKKIHLLLPLRSFGSGHPHHRPQSLSGGILRRSSQVRQRPRRNNPTG